MKKYYDCSINHISNKIHTKSNLGPKENDIMRDLHKYSNLYGFERVFDYKDADIIITNTFYPDQILDWSIKNNIPRIKRMDGVYYNENKHKNDLLNKAALQSDHVIFISEYSKNMLYNLYNFLPENNTVILNNADDSIFYKNRNKISDNFTWTTSSTNWDRKDKRLNELIKLSDLMNDDDIINIIGRCDIDLPKRFIKHDYIDNLDDVSKILNTSDVFLSLFFRDAGSKITCQAVQCELPILYTNSGGLSEIVGDNGLMINDYEEYNYLDNVPDLNMDEVYTKYKWIKRNVNCINNNYFKKTTYQTTISNYFDILKKESN
jgi:hypothetical protein